MNTEDSLRIPMGSPVRSSKWVLKRVFDMVVSSVGLIVLAPLFLVLAAVVRATSPGPAFFFQPRIGRHGKRFNCAKFRTMVVGAEEQGTITTEGDPRVTPVGRFLRRFKLDELPQLWNVLTGAMSLVGPRPDVIGYADRLQGDDRRILESRPGITGPSALLFREEERLLALAHDSKAFNDAVVYPEKLRINLSYLETRTFWRDIGYLVSTVLPHLTRRLGLDRRLGLNYGEFLARMEQEARRY